MFDTSRVPSYVILQGSLGIYAHAHSSKTVLAMDAQKYIIKMHFILDRKEDTVSTLASLLCPRAYLFKLIYILLTRNYASNHRSTDVVQTT